MGWSVHRRSSGAKEQRKCISTRNDGVIIIEFGINAEAGKPFMAVSVE